MINVSAEIRGYVLDKPYIKTLTIMEVSEKIIAQSVDKENVQATYQPKLAITWRHTQESFTSYSKT